MSAYRAIIVTTVLASGASVVGLVAQQQAPPAAAADQQDQQIEAQLTDQLKVQVKNFEAVLRTAVENGGRRLQMRAKELLELAPELRLVSEPAVLGAPLPDGGIVFTVEVPDLMQTWVDILSYMQQRRNNNRPVATAPPDPALPERGSGPVIPNFDPDKEYSDFVREGLIEAMIENSQALRLADSADLVVIASVAQIVRRNPLDTSRLLILSIKGEHLTAYRQNRSTKEEVKQRIVDRRF